MKARSLILGATVLAGTACADVTGTSASARLDQAAVAAALSTVPVGYGDLTSSYVGVPTGGVPDAGLWLAGGREARFDRGSLMGGGIGDAFVGNVGFNGGSGGHRGPFGGGLGCAGTFDAATGRVVCPTMTRHGLTVTRSAQFKTSAGAVQQAFDTATTNSVNIQSSVAGTVTFTRDSASAGGHGPGGHGRGWGHGRGPGGRLLGDTSTVLSASTVIASSSSRTTTGLAAGSTQRVVDGASTGTERTTGTSSRGSFTATRAAADTTRGLVIPVRTASLAQPFPTAGTVIRVMSASLQYAGSTPVAVSRREVVTYDGTATAKVVITENGTTRTCTRPLPRGPLSCS